MLVGADAREVNRPQRSQANDQIRQPAPSGCVATDLFIRAVDRIDDRLSTLDIAKRQEAHCQPRTQFVVLRAWLDDPVSFASAQVYTQETSEISG